MTASATSARRESDASADPLVRGVRAAAARAKPVDRHVDPPAARWLASLAPPRPRPRAAVPGSPSAAARAARAVAARESIAGHERIRRRLEPHLVVARAAAAASTGVEGLEAVGPQVADEPPDGGTTLNASPEPQGSWGRRWRRSGPSGSERGRHRLCRGGEGEQRVAPPVRRGARVGGAPPRGQLGASPAALRFTITDSSPSGVAFARLEAQTGVASRRSARRARRGPCATPRRSRAARAASAYSSGRPDSSRIAPSARARRRLHVDAARSRSSGVALALERTVRRVREHGVEGGREQQPGAPPLPRRPPPRVGGVARVVEQGTRAPISASGGKKSARQRNPHELPAAPARSRDRSDDLSLRSRAGPRAFPRPSWTFARPPPSPPSPPRGAAPLGRLGAPPSAAATSAARRARSAALVVRASSPRSRRSAGGSAQSFRNDGMSISSSGISSDERWRSSTTRRARRGSRAAPGRVLGEQRRRGRAGRSRWRSP